MALVTDFSDSGKVNWEQMIKDPFGIPCVRELDADSGILDDVGEALKLECKNLQLKKLLDTEAEHARENLVSTLTTLNPLSFKLASTICELSNVALVDKLVTMFQSSSSILKLLRHYKSFTNLTKEAGERDNSLLKSFEVVTQRQSAKCIQKLVSSSISLGCPTLACDTFRCEIVGQTLINLSEASLIHLTNIIRWDEMPTGQIQLTIKITVEPGVVNCMYTRGPLPSYIGSDTAVRRTASHMILIIPELQDKAALRLGELQSWITTAVHLDGLLTTVIGEKTDTCSHSSGSI